MFVLSKILQIYTNKPFGEAFEPKFNIVCFRRLFGGPALDILILSQFFRRNCAKKQNENICKQESPAVADKPARRLRKVCTVYVRAVGL